MNVQWTVTFIVSIHNCSKAWLYEIVLLLLMCLLIYSGVYLSVLMVNIYWHIIPKGNVSGNEV